MRQTEASSQSTRRPLVAVRAMGGLAVAGTLPACAPALPLGEEGHVGRLQKRRHRVEAARGRASAGLQEARERGDVRAERRREGREAGSRGVRVAQLTNVEKTKQFGRLGAAVYFRNCKVNQIYQNLFRGATKYGK